MSLLIPINPSSAPTLDMNLLTQATEPAGAKFHALHIGIIENVIGNFIGNFIWCMEKLDF